MDRRSFFTSLTAVAVVPLVGCVHRDRPDHAEPPPLTAFRKFVIPDGIEPALPFVPLRRRTQP